MLHLLESFNDVNIHIFFSSANYSQYEQIIITGQLIVFSVLMVKCWLKTCVREKLLSSSKVCLAPAPSRTPPALQGAPG